MKFVKFLPADNGGAAEAVGASPDTTALQWNVNALQELAAAPFTQLLAVLTHQSDFKEFLDSFLKSRRRPHDSTAVTSDEATVCVRCCALEGVARRECRGLCRRGCLPRWIRTSCWCSCGLQAAITRNCLNSVLMQRRLGGTCAVALCLPQVWFPSPPAFVPARFLYDSWVMDVPKLLDIASLYGSSAASGPHRAAATHIIKFVFTNERRYFNDLAECLGSIAEARRCCIPLYN